MKEIENQLRAEIGEGWETDEEALRGRNAVRREHGLPPLGDVEDRPAADASGGRPLWRRVLGR